MSAVWVLEQVRDLLLVRCAPLVRVPGIAHAFSTRCGEGGDDFDLGARWPGNPAVWRRRESFLRAAGCAGDRPYIVRQVHGAEVVRATLDGSSVPQADAIVWRPELAGERPAAVRTADCVPLLLAHRRGRAAAAVHAGWRGTAAGVVGRSVEALEACGLRAGELVAALGPAIRGCCYEVDRATWSCVTGSLSAPQVAGRPAARRDHFMLDLHAAIGEQLAAAGVPRERVFSAPWCTRCRADLFFSYRRQGRSAGRQMACIGGRPGAPFAA